VNGQPATEPFDGVRAANFLKNDEEEIQMASHLDLWVLIASGGKRTEKLSEALYEASSYIQIVEMAVDDITREKLSDYRLPLEKTAQVLALPNTIITNINAARKIYGALDSLKGSVYKNPTGAAKAFGKLFAGVGELAQYLPWPANSYIGLFAEAEDFFVNMQIQIVPHMRPSHRRVADEIRRVDNIGLFDSP
jgi:hypothetical protein